MKKKKPDGPQKRKREKKKRKQNDRADSFIPCVSAASATRSGTTNDDVISSDKKTAKMKIIIQKPIRNAKTFQCEHNLIPQDIS